MRSKLLNSPANVNRGRFHVVCEQPSEVGVATAQAAGDRCLMATVYADMVGYSRLFGLDDTGTVARIRALHRELIAPMLRCYRGWLAQTAGDSMLMLFDSVIDAVQCAVAVQRQVWLRNCGWPAEQYIHLRIGLDIGDVIIDGTDVHGDGVIVATRLQAICPPGGVCVSRAVHDRAGDRLGLGFEELGLLKLKNVARPIEALVLRPETDRIALTAPGCRWRSQSAHRWRRSNSA